MRTSRSSVLAVAVLGLVASACSAWADFAGTLPPAYSPIANALATSVGRSLPVPAASSGFRYSFDPRTNVFEREVPLLGQLYLERAETIGAGRWQLDVGWQRIAFDTYEGRDLDKIALGKARLPAKPVPVVLLKYGGSTLDLTVDQTFLNATWGATERLELNLTLPVLASHFERATRPVIAPASTIPFLPATQVSEDAAGVGDLLLRGKWRLTTGRFGRLAGGLVVQLPTGSRDNFQGTGELELGPMLYASTPRARWHGIEFEGYLNLGPRVAVTDASQSEARWGVGLDVSPHPRVAIGLAVLARHAFTGPSTVRSGCSETSLDLADPNSCLAVAASGKPPDTALGIASGRPDYYDFSAGLRVRLWREWLMAFGNVIIPLNRDGFRADVIPLVGIEATF